jgi:hypothetical protein
MLSSPRSSLARPKFRVDNSAFAPKPRTFFASRCYATEPASQEAKSDSAGPADTDGKAAEAETADPVKTELEAKNKEIIDLKV